MKKKLITVVMVAMVVAFSSSKMAKAEITSSAHDLSGAGWNSEGEVCNVCHTPHNALAEDVAAPLWSHAVTSATYTVYSSDSFTRTAEQPRAESKACLSCHDGTVAIDSYGGKTGAASFPSGPALIGTDLSDDHPISIDWLENSHWEASLNCLGCHFVHGATHTGGDLVFFDGYIECATCHDVHNGTAHPKMLRKAGGDICLHCHNK